MSCAQNTKSDQEGKKDETIISTPLHSKIIGTWKLISAKKIINTDTTITKYTNTIEGIKIINTSHFSFFQHDLKKGKDSVPKFSSGGGKYVLNGNKYVEFLEYCSARAWENNKFEFTIAIKNDTLTQTGIERIPSLDVDQTIIETYVKTNNNNTPIPVIHSFEDKEVSWFSTKGAASIKGIAKFKSRNEKIHFGDQFRIELMPFSRYTEERLLKIYNNKDSGVVYLEDGVPRFIPDPEAYHQTIKTTCNEKGEFEFTDLPDGEYYIIAFMIWDQKVDTKITNKTGGGIMQRIHLTEGEVNTVELVNFN
ncbi:hypothetical protein GCM10022393_05130 [Aquimarina addita]|uniref:Lipocalin-like domain-containing protein n=1 Tax=Aquimarina addita TaxID=870485 RepID=A0ABP7XA13_9FLAO